MAIRRSKYKDWRTFDPVTMRNEQIRNTPEAARGGYSALDPLATITASVLTPDWAKRTPTEQARVNAAQARAQEQSASTPEATSGFGSYASLVPVSPYEIPDRVIPAPNSTMEGRTRLANSNKIPVREAETYGGVGNARTKEQSEAAWARAEADRASGRRIEETYAGRVGLPKKETNANTLGYDAFAPANAPAQTATVQNATGSTETVPKTDAGSPSTGDTELTGYAKYLADHPEYAETNRRAEAEYARAMPTYGALAEQMAQAGIHGGYSDYLQGVAYAQMQNAKQQNEEAARQGYKDYLAQQEAARDGNGGAVMSENAKALYQNLLSEYGDQIAGITDETQYAQFEDLFRAANKGLYSEADIESALGQAREYRTTQKNIDAATVSQGIANYTTGDGGDNDLLRSLGYDPATFIEPQGEKESDEDYAKRYGKAFISAVNDAYKENRIDKQQHSAILTTAMPIFDEDFDTMDWKDKGVSIAASIDLAINGDLTTEDYAKVVNSVKEHLKSVGVESIYYDHQGIGRSSNLDIKIRGGAKNFEDIHADQVGGNITQAEKNKLAEYNDLPLAYLVNSDGTTTLYYQNEHGWRQLKTKGGSTSGSPKLGNNWYKAIAFLMMNGNKPTETVTTKKNQTYTFITE